MGKVVLGPASPQTLWHSWAASVSPRFHFWPPVILQTTTIQICPVSRTSPHNAGFKASLYRTWKVSKVLPPCQPWRCRGERQVIKSNKVSPLVMSQPHPQDRQKRDSGQGLPSLLVPVSQPEHSCSAFVQLRDPHSAINSPISFPCNRLCS